jgi:hypothetical protein
MLMTTIRMFAFIAAVLVTAFLFRVFAYGLSAPQHDEVSIFQHAAVGAPTNSPLRAD